MEQRHECGEITSNWRHFKWLPTHFEQNQVKFGLNHKQVICTSKSHHYHLVAVTKAAPRKKHLKHLTKMCMCLVSCLALKQSQTQPDLLQLVWQLRDPILTQETLTGELLWFRDPLQVKSQIVTTHELDLNHSNSGGKNPALQMQIDAIYLCNYLKTPNISLLEHYSEGELKDEKAQGEGTEKFNIVLLNLPRDTSL